jgi:hypothetical protein
MHTNATPMPTGNGYCAGFLKVVVAADLKRAITINTNT